MESGLVCSLKTRLIRAKCLQLVALFIVASCTTQPSIEPAPAPVSLPPVSPAVQEPVDDGLIEVRLDRFCADLGRIIDAEAHGFTPLRINPLGQREWAGAIVPDGLISCTVEGPRRPIATYDCRSQALAGKHEGLLDPTFRQTASDLDQCFERSTWYPREWRRGRVIEFGRGEKQITWRDITSSPKPAVSLHIEEDFANRVHYLRLAVGTLN